MTGAVYLIGDTKTVPGQLPERSVDLILTGSQGSRSLVLTLGWACKGGCGL